MIAAGHRRMGFVGACGPRMGARHGTRKNALDRSPPWRLMSAGGSRTRRPEWQSLRMRARDGGVDEKELGKMSLGLGILTLAVDFANRLGVLNSVEGVQSRSDLVGVICGVTMILYGLATRDVNVRAEQQVELDGQFVDEKGADVVSESALQKLRGAARSVCDATTVRSVIVLKAGQVLYRYGVMGQAATVDTDAEIIKQALSKPSRTYFARVEILPAKEQLNFLPNNVQAVLFEPLPENGLLILGASKVRPFTPEDFGWIRALSNLIASLEL
ncbi:Protein COFACTOR ASSEMBLY OF COMPLEX C SUBUNIT B CCB4, chloroplastic [Porphyridium purpureum]|uniref:Protein COFACTOR ASSEMBLY OF COMPLEX C SUBUNIT B CCB4, chloroplastic n=1 Tax=Porphyridium purpureum TaxID=35688 RepID=A0A5J4YWK4_PORPP|nr:Protein COFACTOR ASSEMBLY OF COMPLEX C SUBUNIT B CCB4, chloroplastic [Porphyridium purpureum]|eukprot:POR0946..scf209_3